MKKYISLILAFFFLVTLVLFLLACSRPSGSQKLFQLNIQGGEDLTFSGLDFYQANDEAELKKIREADPEDCRDLVEILGSLKEVDPGLGLSSLPSSESLILQFQTEEGPARLYLYDEEPMPDGFYYYSLESPKKSRVFQSEENLIPPLKKQIGLQSFFSHPFTDIQGHWAEEAIDKAYKEGSLQGLSEDKFGPDIKLTRAMLVQALYQKNGGKKADKLSPPSFADLPKDAWYAQALAWAQKEDLIFGDKDGNFRPKKDISREEFALVLYRYTAYLGNLHQDQKGQTFADQKDIASWAKEAVGVMKAEGYMKGDPEGNFRPKDPLTRGELAQVFSSKSL